MYSRHSSSSSLPSAHTRYHPNEISNESILKQFASIRQSSKETKFELYQEEDVYKVS